MTSLTLQRITLKAELQKHLDDVARLRLSVFRAYPYLYDGSAAYEKKYLQTYMDADHALVVLALDGSRVVGASTGLPMCQETDAVKQPFLAAGHDIARLFYCGETVLEPAYRGRGLYRQFFAARENHARQLGGFDYATFCGVIRPENHSHKPHGFTPLDAVWQHFGYVKKENLVTSFSWKEIDESQETEKPMQFWLKDLRQAA